MFKLGLVVLLNCLWACTPQVALPSVVHSTANEGPCGAAGTGNTPYRAYQNPPRCEGVLNGQPVAGFSLRSFTLGATPDLCAADSASLQPVSDLSNEQIEVTVYDVPSNYRMSAIASSGSILSWPSTVLRALFKAPCTSLDAQAYAVRGNRRIYFPIRAPNGTERVLHFKALAEGTANLRANVFYLGNSLNEEASEQRISNWSERSLNARYTREPVYVAIPLNDLQKPGLYRLTLSTEDQTVEIHFFLSRMLFSAGLDGKI